MCLDTKCQTDSRKFMAVTTSDTSPQIHTDPALNHNRRICSMSLASIVGSLWAIVWPFSPSYRTSFCDLSPCCCQKPFSEEESQTGKIICCTLTLLQHNSKRGNFLMEKLKIILCPCITEVKAQRADHCLMFYKADYKATEGFWSSAPEGKKLPTQFTSSEASNTGSMAVWQ